MVPGTGDAGHLLAVAGRARDVDAAQQGPLVTMAPAEVMCNYRSSPQVSDGEDRPLLHWSEARGVPGPTVGVAKEPDPGGLVWSPPLTCTPPGRRGRPSLGHRRVVRPERRSPRTMSRPAQRTFHAAPTCLGKVQHLGRNPPPHQMEAKTPPELLCWQRRGWLCGGNVFNMYKWPLMHSYIP